MKYVQEEDVAADRVGPPYQRTIRHLVTPSESGSKNLWVGSSSIDPGFASNPHGHEAQEEVFYCVSGRGRIRVDAEEMPLEPGVAVFVPPQHEHQLINDGDEVLKVLAVVSPPFDRAGFLRDHRLGESLT